ncbi:MAG: hypothetical protein COS88_06405 [Chloroflexi bacterium CG07_land_8_20_14_0_80_51_10]|nr:MAG: hypothetical protein COS88_06405 [Chloroflexi bacterium CG07_land_8_20_14_0_80_51_10]
MEGFININPLVADIISCVCLGIAFILFILMLTYPSRLKHKERKREEEREEIPKEEVVRERRKTREEIIDELLKEKEEIDEILRKKGFKGNPDDNYSIWMLNELRDLRYEMRDLRYEMRGLRSEMGTGFEGMRSEMETGFEGMRSEMRGWFLFLIGIIITIGLTVLIQIGS